MSDAAVQCAARAKVCGLRGPGSFQGGNREEGPGGLSGVRPGPLALRYFCVGAFDFVFATCEASMIGSFA